jgi:uncharacterized membrane protein required for colicin V production
MWYDLLTLGILMYAMFRGAMKGIVWQLATIAALLMCFFFSGTLSAAVAPFIRVEPPMNQWIAMLILYLGFSFVSFGIARVAHEMIESMRIEALDRHLGAILGLVKGGMFSLFLTFFLVTLSHSARESIINSESGYVAAVVIDRLDPVIPGDLHALLEPYIRRLDAPEIEREHREERLAREGRGDDYRGSLDRRDLDDRDDAGRDRPFDADRDLTRRPLPGDQRDLDDRDLHRRDDDRQDTALDRDGKSRPVDYERGDKRTSGDPFSAADADTPRRHRERRRADERSDLRPASDSAADLAQTTSEESDWLSSLPTLTDELKQMAVRAWRKTRPERRRELTRRLSSGSVPDLIRKTLQEWLDGPPVSAGPPDGERLDSERLDGGRTDGARTDGERAKLEHDISRSLVANRPDRQAAIDDMEGSLRGIPDDVALKVLRDWRADLLDKNSDPDPSTTDRSSLNDRILSQLSKSGVSLRSLDSATRERLRPTDTR